MRRIFFGFAAFALVAAILRRERRQEPGPPSPAFEVYDPGPLRPDIEAFVDAISDEVTSEHVGIGASRSEVYDHYSRLARRIDRETALRLLAHPRPAVRTWMALHVIEHLPKDAPLLLPLLRDSSTLHTQVGCVGRNETVSTWVLQALAIHGENALLATVVRDPTFARDTRLHALDALGPAYESVVRDVARTLGKISSKTPQIAQLATESPAPDLDAMDEETRARAIRWSLPRHHTPAIRAWLRAQVARSTFSLRSPPPAQEKWKLTTASTSLELLARAPDIADLALARRFVESDNPFERRAAAEVILKAGEVADVENLLSDNRHDEHAADRLFWMGATGSIEAVRAAARMHPSKGLERIANDLARLRGDLPMSALGKPSVDDPPPIVVVEVTTPECKGVPNASATIANHLWQFRKVYRESLEDHANMSGAVAVTFEVDEHGFVRTTAGAQAPKELAKLVTNAMHYVNFARGAAGRCTATLNFRIRR